MAKQKTCMERVLCEAMKDKSSMEVLFRRLSGRMNDWDYLGHNEGVLKDLLAKIGIGGHSGAVMTYHKKAVLFCDLDMRDGEESLPSWIIFGNKDFVDIRRWHTPIYRESDTPQIICPRNESRTDSLESEEVAFDFIAYPQRYLIYPIVAGIGIYEQEGDPSIMSGNYPAVRKHMADGVTNLGNSLKGLKTFKLGLPSDVWIEADRDSMPKFKRELARKISDLVKSVL